MSSLTSYWLGFNAGKGADEYLSRYREAADAVFYPRRPTVVVDAADLARLQDEAHYNFQAGKEWEEATHQFHGEALDWKDRALRAEADAEALRAELAEARASHEQKDNENFDLRVFLYMARALLDAHRAGRTDRPEFTELRDIAHDASTAINRGEPFDAYRRDPDAIKTLVNALYPTP